MKLEEEVKKFMDSKNKSMITATEYQEKAKTTAINITLYGVLKNWFNPTLNIFSFISFNSN